MKNIFCITKKRSGDAPRLLIEQTKRVDEVMGEPIPRHLGDFSTSKAEDLKGRVGKRETGGGGASFETGSRFESRIPGGPAEGVVPIQILKQCGFDVHAERGGCVEIPIPKGMRRVLGKLKRKMNLLQAELRLIHRVSSINSVEESLR